MDLGRVGLLSSAGKIVCGIDYLGTDILAHRHAEGSAITSVEELLLLTETAATLFMAGVLCTMQVLNYPLLSLVGREALPAYEQVHNRRFGLVVFPGVLLALLAAIGLIIERPHQLPVWAPIGEVLLLIAIIVSTAVLQAPQHARLAHEFDSAAHRLLVRSNWIRVAAWSAAGLLALWMSSRAMTG